MHRFTSPLIEEIISHDLLMQDYPKSGVIFLPIAPFFSKPALARLIKNALKQLIKQSSTQFDGVAGIASRGYVYSGILANQHPDIPQCFIEKVKLAGHRDYTQSTMTTEYSSDALQIQKGSIEAGKTYLVTDDLIATGGSVMAAIDLIEREGGIVKNALVMTELLDMAARKKLKDRGIELISLLKFTNADLQQLLHLSQLHKTSAEKSLSYKLSCHQSHNGTYQVYVGSESSIKNKAVSQALAKHLPAENFDVTGIAVTSDVSEQPLETETRVGAENRLNQLQRAIGNHSNTLLIAIENGLRFDKQSKTYKDFVCLSIQLNGQTHTHRMDCCTVPNEIAKQTDANTTWGEVACKAGLATNSKDPHSAAAFGGISRQQHIETALASTLSKALSIKPFTLKRCIRLNLKDGIRKQNKKGIFFFGKHTSPSREVIEIHTHSPEHRATAESSAASNKVTIFSTGDLFVTLPATQHIRAKNVHIHVTPSSNEDIFLLGIHEALQLCRTAYEHGAAEVTVVLPEECHPILQADDFHFLLPKLFKAAGAHEAYFKSADNGGQLEKSYRSDTFLSGLNQRKITQQLHLTPTSEALTEDQQILHHLRRRKFVKSWLKTNPNKIDILAQISPSIVPQELNIESRADAPHIIFYNSTNQHKAEAMQKRLTAAGEHVQLAAYSGSGIHATLPLDISLREAHVTLLHTTRPNPDDLESCAQYQQFGATPRLFEVVCLANQCRLRGAKNISFVNPYQFGARSDKAEDNSKGKAGAYVQLNGRLLEASGVHQIYTAECHDAHTLSGSYTTSKLRSTAIQTMSNMVLTLAKAWVVSPHYRPSAKLRLVAPDAGADKRTKQLNQTLKLTLGEKFCHARIVGDKQRGCHKDDSAVISGVSDSGIGVSEHDRYFITDDETATGGTLCQAINSIKAQGAKDIAIILVHNNLPLECLTRHLCLARFIHMGASELHFSDSQPMGTLCDSYDTLIARVAKQQSTSLEAVEQQFKHWVHANVANANETTLASFKCILDGGLNKVACHPLSEDFAAALSAHTDYAEVESDERACTMR